VYAVDTGYGALAWTLRRDPRVVTLERTNALHVELPEQVTLVVIDVAWTRQHLIIPAAARLLGPGGQIISLIKPHYEAERNELRGGVLLDDQRPEILERVRARLREAGFALGDVIESPIAGHKGNREYLGSILPPARPPS
jgi:23S rRNA (cytidine1920-2'-O)/16S rRNA (cytidine1409-2'-O)-methyltransferase